MKKGNRLIQIKKNQSHEIRNCTEEIWFKEIFSMAKLFDLKQYSIMKFWFKNVLV